MKQFQPKFAILTVLIVLALFSAGCARERSEEPASLNTSGSTGGTVPTAAIIAATTTSSQPTPEGSPTTLAIKATATPEAGKVETELTESTESTVTTSGATDPTATPITSIPGTNAGSGQEQIHVVQPGQNLFRIALQYGFDTDTVARYNGITNPEMIYVGQKIRIPAGGGSTVPSGTNSGGTYVVQAGDSLLSIAVYFGTSTEALMSANNLSDADMIYAGQSLYVPR